MKLGFWGMLCLLSLLAGHWVEAVLASVLLLGSVPLDDDQAQSSR